MLAIFGAKFLSSKSATQTLKIKICRSIFFRVVLYRCETLSLTVREEHRLRVIENRVWRRIFGLNETR